MPRIVKKPEPHSYPTWADSYKVYMGIDPGNSGGAVLVDAKGDPVLKEDGKLYACVFDHNKITEQEVGDWFLSVVDGPFLLKAAIEIVHSMPKQGVASSFTFGRSYGFLRGLLAGCKVSFEQIRPAVWQKHMRCLSGGDKKITKAAAHRKWPAHSKQITNAFADAMLLADWCRRVDQGLIK